MPVDDQLLRFFGLLADVRTMFLDIQRRAERSPALKDISVQVIPVRTGASGTAGDGLLVSVPLAATLVGASDPQKEELEISLLLRFEAGSWEAEAGIGWITSYGLETFEEIDARADSFDELARAVPAMIQWLETRFAEVVPLLPAKAVS